MHVKVTKDKKGKATIEGDAQFFAWLTTAANSAANGFQGNKVEGKLELVTTQPSDIQPKATKTSLRPDAPALDPTQS